VPADPAADVAAGAEWLTPADVAERTLFQGEALAAQVGAIRDLEAMSAARDG